MGTFLLLPSQEEPVVQEPAGQKGLGSAVLLRNAQWFTKVRWIVIAVFALAGLIGRIFLIGLARLGLALPSQELWVLASILTPTNLIFHYFNRNIGKIERRS